MTLEKTMIIGGSGLLGSRLLDFVTGEDVIATYRSNPMHGDNMCQLDIASSSQVEKVFKEVVPTLVIHAAAYTDVDGCEKDRVKAHAVNAQGTENIARAARKHRAKLVYVSTDYVFDGLTGMYGESDKTNPISYYGLTKLQGEQFVRDICDDFIIARTSVLYGRGRRNFATWIIEGIRSGKTLRIANQYVSPTLNTDLVHQILALVEADATGIYHTAGADRISRVEFALEIAGRFGLDPNMIVACPPESMDWLAQRPRDSSLDVSKVSAIRRPLSVHEAVRELKEEIK